MTDFQVGDRVRIREGTRFYGRGDDNPAGVEGTVRNIVSSRLRVIWDNGWSNGYDSSDLELSERWVLVEGREAGRATWTEFLSKFERLDVTVCHWPSMSGRVWINLSTKKYTNYTRDLGGAEFKIVKLSEILGG